MKKLFFIFFTLMTISVYSQKKTNVDVIALDSFNNNSSLKIVSGKKDPLMI